MMTTQKKIFALLVILVVATVLRLFQLGSNPPSLDWDEVSLGYNAYSILQTGSDEYGSFLPLAIRSFGDYKPPLYTYITIIPVAMLGLTEFAVRVPSAVFGVLGVLFTYLLAVELFALSGSRSNGDRVALLVAGLLAISPWHLQFSRVAFEANVGLTFFIIGAWAFLKGLRNGRFLVVSAISFTLSVYAYHSPRLVAPVFILGLALWFRKKLLLQKEWVIIAAVVGLLLTAPIARSLLTGTTARFQSVTSLSPEALEPSIQLLATDLAAGDSLGALLHNRRVVYALTIAQGYLDHFEPNFLFVTGDGPARHHAAGMGMLLLVSVPFVLWGIFLSLRQREAWAPVVFWWFLTAPLASALTTGTPHAVRALLFLPTFQIFAAFGLYELYTRLRLYKGKPIRAFAAAVPLLFVANFIYYLNLYYVHTPIEHARDWQFGYKQAVAEVVKHKDDVNKIIFTFAYDQPYIYPLFYEPVDPAWYQHNWGNGEIVRDFRAFGTYEFRIIDWEQDSQQQNVLLVGTPQEIPDNVSGEIAEIAFPDGSIAFRIVFL